ncbi:hypothetical protein B0H14DRAFT_3456963 [Mycena olivaceomarginata]|nr:hypothetical protein B0H14DRAFT_3456963 [Mycena olivaceomarginata]
MSAGFDVGLARSFIPDRPHLRLPRSLSRIAFPQTLAPPVRWERPSSYMQPIPPHTQLAEHARNLAAKCRVHRASFAQICQLTTDRPPDSLYLRPTQSTPHSRIKTLVHHTEIKSTAFNFNVLTFKHQM